MSNCEVFMNCKNSDWVPKSPGYFSLTTRLIKKLEFQAYRFEFRLKWAFLGRCLSTPHLRARPREVGAAKVAQDIKKSLFIEIWEIPQFEICQSEICFAIHCQICEELGSQPQKASTWNSNFLINRVDVKLWGFHELQKLWLGSKESRVLFTDNPVD